MIWRWILRWADYAGLLDGPNIITRVDISEGRRQCQSDTEETDMSIDLGL